MSYRRGAIAVLVAAGFAGGAAAQDKTNEFDTLLRHRQYRHRGNVQ